MEERVFKILLKDQFIGTSAFEGKGAPKGVVYGVLNFNKDVQGKEYNFIKQYCIEHSCEIRNDFTMEKIIATGTLTGMKVMTSDQETIAFQGNQLTGMQGDGFDIVLEGVSEENIERFFMG